MGRLRYNQVIYLVKSRHPGGVDRVPVYYKGQWDSANWNGERGDVKARPVSIGGGPFTCTCNKHDFEHEDGTPVDFPIR